MKLALHKIIAPVIRGGCLTRHLHTMLTLRY